MPKYQHKAQVLFTEDQYTRLLQISRREDKKLGALLWDAAEPMYLRKARAYKKAQAVRELLAPGPIAAPDDYEAWEEQYLREKYSGHA